MESTVLTPAPSQPGWLMRCSVISYTCCFVGVGGVNVDALSVCVWGGGLEKDTCDGGLYVTSGAAGS